MRDPDGHELSFAGRFDILNEVNMVSRSTAALRPRTIPECSVQQLASGFRALHSRQDIFAEELNL